MLAKLYYIFRILQSKIRVPDCLNYSGHIKVDVSLEITDLGSIEQRDAWGRERARETGVLERARHGERLGLLRRQGFRWKRRADRLALEGDVRGAPVDDGLVHCLVPCRHAGEDEQHQYHCLMRPHPAAKNHHKTDSAYPHIRRVQSTQTICQ